jgi:hypothetical protein
MCFPWGKLPNQYLTSKVTVMLTLAILQFLFLWCWGFELSLALARQVLYCLSHAFSPFCSGYFGGRVSLFAQDGLNHIPLG